MDQVKEVNGDFATTTAEFLSESRFEHLGMLDRMNERRYLRENNCRSHAIISMPRED